MDSLELYKTQLLQVEAALVQDAENEELLKLKADLEEVIELSKGLYNPTPEQKVEKKSTEVSPSDKNVKSHSWKVGDTCLAPWNQDGQYYDATIDKIEEDGSVEITFTEYGNKGACDVAQLKSVGKRPACDYEYERAKKAKLSTKNMDKEQMREYVKKRKEKKQERFKQLEQEREQGKNSWLAFNNKSKKGLSKKSIFATPENANARVGIGTCGVSGKEMTKFEKPQKWT